MAPSRSNTPTSGESSKANDLNKQSSTSSSKKGRSRDGCSGGKRQSVPGNAQEQPGLASESSDDLEVVEEKIVKKYEGAEAGASAGRKIKSIRIPIKIPKSLSEHIRTSKNISPADFEKIKRLAPSLKDLSRITNCSLHLSGSGNKSHQQKSPVEPEEIDLTEVDANQSDAAQTEVDGDGGDHISEIIEPVASAPPVKIKLLKSKNTTANSLPSTIASSHNSELTSSPSGVADDKKGEGSTAEKGGKLLNPDHVQTSRIETTKLPTDDGPNQTDSKATAKATDKNNGPCSDQASDFIVTSCLPKSHQYTSSPDAATTGTRTTFNQYTAVTNSSPNETQTGSDNFTTCLNNVGKPSTHREGDGRSLEHPTPESQAKTDPQKSHSAADTTNKGSKEAKVDNLVLVLSDSDNDEPNCDSRPEKDLPHLITKPATDASTIPLVACTTETDSSRGLPSVAGLRLPSDTLIDEEFPVKTNCAGKLTSTENELSDENKVFTNQEKRLKMVEEIENLGMGEVQTSAAKKYLYSSLEDGNHSDRAYTDVQQYIDRIKAGNLPATVGSSRQIFNNSDEPVGNELSSSDCVVEAFAGGINHTDHLGLNDVPVKKAEGSSAKKRGSVFKQARTLGKSFAQQKKKVTSNGKAALKKNEEVTLKGKVSPAGKKCNNNRSSGSEIEQSPSPVSISQVGSDMMEVPLYDDFDPVPLVVRRASIIKEPGPPQPSNDRNTENKVSKQSISEISKEAFSERVLRKGDCQQKPISKIDIMGQEPNKIGAVNSRGGTMKEISALCEHKSGGPNGKNRNPKRGHKKSPLPKLTDQSSSGNCDKQAISNSGHQFMEGVTNISPNDPENACNSQHKVCDSEKSDERRVPPTELSNTEGLFRQLTTKTGKSKDHKKRRLMVLESQANRQSTKDSNTEGIFCESDEVVSPGQTSHAKTTNEAEVSLAAAQRRSTRSRRSARMSFGKEVSPQQLAQAQQLARKKLVAECENAGQPVPRVLVVTDEEREALVANGNHDGTNDSIVIDVEDIFQTCDLPDFLSNSERPAIEEHKPCVSSGTTTEEVPCTPKPLSKKLPALTVAKTFFFQRQLGMRLGGHATSMLYVPLTLFSDLLSSMKFDLNQLQTHMLFYDERNKLTKQLNHNIHNHFIYQNSQVSHVSVIAARELCALFNHERRSKRVIPKFVSKALRDLMQPMKSKVQLQTLAPHCIGQNHSGSTATACENVPNRGQGKRIKHPTVKLQGCTGNFKNLSSCLLPAASIDSSASCDDSFLSFGNDYASLPHHTKSVTELVAEKESHQFKKITGKSFTGRLRPKYRLFLKTSSPESSNQAKSEPSPVKNIKKQAHRSAKTSPFKKVVPGNSDTDKALNLSPSTDNSKNNNTSKAKRKRKGKNSPRDQLALSDKGFKKPQQKEPNSANTGEQEQAVGHERVIRPCRKFASNDVLAVHNAAYPKPQSENQAPPPPPKKVKMAQNPVDLPMFSLLGLSETKPMEREGWFTNKISQLKRVVADATTLYRSSSSYTSASSYLTDPIDSADQPKALKRTRQLPAPGGGKATPPPVKKAKKRVVKKVNVSFSLGLEQIVDLEEFRTNLHQQIVTLESFKSTIPASEQAEQIVETAAAAAATPEVPVIEPVNVKELLFVSKRVEKVSCSGINRPRQEFKDTAQLPPGWMKLTEENGGQVWYVSPEGVRCGTLGLAFKYLEKQFALTSTMRRRRREF